MDIQPLVLSKDNVHICSFKSHELNNCETIVKQTLLYGVETWGSSLNKANNWKDLERPLLSTIARIIRSKALMPHHIIQTEMGAAPIIIVALFQLITCIQWFWELPKGRYSRLALMSSRQLAENGDIHCWYAEMQQSSESHGISINPLPPHSNITFTIPI